jgi:hypothetical protein
VLSLRHCDGSIPEDPLDARRGSDPPGTRLAVLYARHIGLASCSRELARVASTAACDKVGDMGLDSGSVQAKDETFV